MSGREDIGRAVAGDLQAEPEWLAVQIPSMGRGLFTYGSRKDHGASVPGSERSLDRQSIVL